MKTKTIYLSSVSMLSSFKAFEYVDIQDIKDELQRRNIEIQEDTEISDNVRIFDNVFIDIDVKIGYGVTICSFVLIRAGAKIKDGVTIAERTDIGCNVTIKNKVNRPIQIKKALTDPSVKLMLIVPVLLLLLPLLKYVLSSGNPLILLISLIIWMCLFFGLIQIVSNLRGDFDDNGGNDFMCFLPSGVFSLIVMTIFAILVIYLYFIAREILIPIGIEI